MDFHPIGVVRTAHTELAATPIQSSLNRAEHARIVLDERYADGLSASLKAGVAAVPAEATAAMVFLGDMPVIPAAVLPLLAEAIEHGATAAATIHRSQRGHPVVLSRALFPAIQTLTGDQGAGPLLKGLGEGLALIPTDDPGVLLDVDRPGDAPP